MKNTELIAIVLIVLIVTIGAYFIVSVVYQPKQSANIPMISPQTTSPLTQTVVSSVQTVVTTNRESTSPGVKILSQKCEPDTHNFPVVTTVLSNNGDTAITSDLILKIYNEGNSPLGTFKQSVTLPPQGNNSIKIIMYGVNYFQTYSMSAEFPGLEQTSPPRKNSGYTCPEFRKA